MLFTKSLFAQFPGPVGTVGTTAIYKDSSIFTAWATDCSIQRGLMDISNFSLGLTNIGDSSMALGISGINDVVSLGDGGSAILNFDYPITNGPGYDFAVFENAFNDVFLELAFVEVSSDGLNYVRFPATSNTQTTSQIEAFSNSGDASKINNLAGKYRKHYGTPFDLQEIAGAPLVNINAITHVKIIDVVGSIDPLYVTYDINNNPINDPFPTAFASGGFDLDALGIIHQNTTTAIKGNTINALNVFPNPFSQNEQLTIHSNQPLLEIVVKNNLGQLIFKGSESDLKNMQFSDGLFTLEIKTTQGTFIKKVIKQ